MILENPCIFDRHPASLDKNERWKLIAADVPLDFPSSLTFFFVGWLVG